MGGFIKRSAEISLWLTAITFCQSCFLFCYAHGSIGSDSVGSSDQKMASLGNQESLKNIHMLPRKKRGLEPTGYRPEGIWSPWGLWGICSKSCDSGWQHRKRNRTSTSHRETETQLRPCNLKSCATIWSKWGPWGSCSRSCNLGWQERKRNRTLEDYIDFDTETKECKLMSCHDKGFNCSFEKTCEFLKVSKTGDYSWEIGSGRTSTALTGPLSDHTLNGEPGGKYIYADGSNGHPGDTAEFSVIPFKSTMENYCFRFWYHLFGINIKRFKVTVQFNNSINWTILNESGKRERRWFNREVDFSVTAGTLITIIFGAIRGNGDKCDIAVDDIMMTSEGCTVDQNAPVLECNFDHSSCLLQRKEDDFDWTRKLGSTPSVGTGPEADHTTGSGYYMFVEASVPRIKNDTATLVTPRLLVKGRETCLNFWYHMNGEDIGELRVNALYEDYTVEILKLSGNKGDKWIEVKSTLLDRIVQVEFTATLSDGYRGDIAIDDVMITEGRCSSHTAWTRWSVWSACSKSCGSGISKKTRQCLDGNTCIGGGTATRTCGGMSCQGQWLAWSSWTCPVSCGSGQKIRYRKCSNSNGTCKGSLYDTGLCYKPCPGEWTHWRTGGCPVSCGNGTQFYIRDCLGGNCIGENNRTSPCFEKNCTGIWAEWAKWSPCSSSCERDRIRTCRGVNCVGSDTDVGKCECPVTLSEWARWNNCEGECEEAKRKRQRHCIQGNCSAIPLTEEELCENQTLCPGNWQHWSSWGDCTRTCGEGIRVKVRKCNETCRDRSGGNNSCCSGKNETTGSCNQDPCPGNWTEWDNWGLCSKNCTEGTRYRSRKCISSPCRDNSTDKELCTPEKPCEGIWGTWSSWFCRVTCGSGNKVRYRNCSIYGFCNGSVFTFGECNRLPCPGSWTPWRKGFCSVTCGEGIQISDRNCPGGYCNGDNHRITTCKKRDCPGQWGIWTNGSCSVTCGTGIHTRTRNCTSGNCQGSNEEIDHCQVRACGVWKAWSPWSCDVTCGSGIKIRKRNCTLSPCNGDREELGTCNKDMCPQGGIPQP